MTDNEALEILRAQGHSAGSPEGAWVRVWILGSDDSIEVRAGRELHEFAEGKLNIEEIRQRRENEVLVKR